MVEPERERVSWTELERLVADLADQVRGEYDLMLAIARGGLVPAGMLAYALGIRNILGTTIDAVAERVRRAGGIPTTAVVHYKPARSRVAREPDHHASVTHRWVLYPFKGER